MTSASGSVLSNPTVTRASGHAQTMPLHEGGCHGLIPAQDGPPGRVDLVLWARQASVMLSMVAAVVCSRRTVVRCPRTITGSINKCGSSQSEAQCMPSDCRGLRLAMGAQILRLRTGGEQRVRVMLANRTEIHRGPRNWPRCAPCQPPCGWRATC